MRWFLLALVLLVWNAQPQEVKKPIPPVENKTQGTDKAKNNAEIKQPITQQLPATINVNVGGKLDVKSERHQSKGDEQHSRLPEIFTAVFTGLLVAVTAWLVFVTRGLLREARKQFPEFRKNVEAATTAAKAAQASAEAASKEFVASHRPLIRIKHVYITSDISADKPIEIKLVIVNAGLTKAIIRSMNIETVLLPNVKTLPPRPEPEFTEPDRTIAIESVAPGQAIALPRMTSHDITSAEHASMMHGTKRLWCFGFVEYMDTDGRVRKTAFCRVWIPPTGPGAYSEPGRFKKVDDPDYEYQD